jgi:hypothetical protein
MLSAHLSELVPLSSAGKIIGSREPEFIEDAAEIFFSEVFADKSMFYAAVANWFKVQTVRGVGMIATP